jgi:hypothetical protein
MYTNSSVLGRYNNGLGNPVLIVLGVAAGIASLVGGGALIKGSINESERRRQVRIAFRNLILNRAKSNPSFLVAWPRMASVDYQILESEASALGMGVVFPSTLKAGANVLLTTSSSGTHVVGLQNPIDMAKVYVSGNALDVAAINSIFASVANSGNNGWMTPDVMNSWKSALMQIKTLPTPLTLRARPKDWSFIDWTLLGAGIMTVGWLGVKYYKTKKRHGRSADTDTVNAAGLAMATNPDGLELDEEALARAKEEYKNFHWGEEATKVETYDVPSEVPDVTSELGELVGVVYRTNKRGDGDTVYVHEFDNPRPRLVTDTDKENLFVVGGRYTIEPRGIVN